MAQLQSVLNSIQNQQRDLALSVRLRLAVDAAGRISQVAAEQVLLNGDTTLVPAFVRWSRAVLSGDLPRSAGASIELARAAAASLPSPVSPLSAPAPPPSPATAGQNSPSPESAVGASSKMTPKSRVVRREGAWAPVEGAAGALAFAEVRCEREAASGTKFRRE